MKTFYSKKKSSILLKLFLIGLTIVIFVILLFVKFNKYATPRIIHLAETKMNKYIEHISSDYRKIISDTENLNLITIKENNNNEIISMDYDMNKIYQIAENLTNYLEENIDSQERVNEYFRMYNNTQLKDGLIMMIPLGELTNSVFLSNIGPKIPVAIRFVNSVFTNVKTKVTDYGINNALLNISLEVKISYQIITPITEEEKVLEYELLLDTSVIQGVVPNIYGGILENKSAFLEVPFKK